MVLDSSSLFPNEVNIYAFVKSTLSVSKPKSLIFHLRWLFLNRLSVHGSNTSDGLIAHRHMTRFGEFSSRTNEHNILRAQRHEGDGTSYDIDSATLGSWTSLAFLIPNRCIPDGRLFDIGSFESFDHSNTSFLIPDINIRFRDPCLVHISILSFISLIFGHLV